MAEPRKARDPMELLDKPQRDVIALMDEVKLFADLNLRERGTLADIAQVVRCPGGDTLVFEAGEEGRFLYCVIKGRLEIRATIGTGLMHTVREVGPGQSAAIDVVLTQAPHHMGCYAVETMAGLRFHTAKLHQLLAIGTPAAIKLFTAMRAEVGGDLREVTLQVVRLLSEASKHSGFAVPASSPGLAGSVVESIAIPGGNQTGRK